MSRGRWIVVGTVLVVAGGVACWFLALQPIREHREWYDRVQAGIHSLVDRRPADVPPGEWEFLVGWTINLHGNCGADFTGVDREQMWAFATELERRLEGPVTAATVDWIWDEYARFTRGGRVYGERYRPTRSPDLPHARLGCFNIRVR